MRNNILMLSDEIHCDLVYEGHPHTPIAMLSPEVQARTITFMAPSKTFNLPGLRASVAIIPDADLRAQYNAARGSLVSGINILGYHAALAAYRDCDDWLAALMEYLTENRRIVQDFLREHLPMLKFYPPEGTYLAWIDCSALPVDEPSVYLREEGKVVFNDGSTFGPGGAKFVRMNFACPRSMLMDGLERMRAAIARLPAAAATAGPAS
jgi:cystathionine beta-lyase